MVPVRPVSIAPGKLAQCSRCGTQLENMSTCASCKRKLPEDVKLLDNTAFKSHKPGIKIEKSSALQKFIRAKRDQIVSECVDHHWSPIYIEKKWGCSADTIRQWVMETYKKKESSESRSSTPILY